MKKIKGVKMEIKINIEKKYFFVLLFVLLVIGGILIVKAFGTNRPQDFGHSFSEIVDDVSGGRIYGSSKSNGGKQLIVTVNEGEGGANDEVWIGPNTVSADGIIVLSAITTDIAKNVKIGGDVRVIGDLRVDGSINFFGVVDVYQCPSIAHGQNCGISGCSGQLIVRPVNVGDPLPVCRYLARQGTSCVEQFANCDKKVGRLVPS